MTHVQIDSLRCPFCHDAIVGTGSKTGCDACLAWHHTACIRELGRCGNCASPAPPLVTPEAVEEAMSELQARRCSHQGCTSIETRETKRGTRICQTHARDASRTLTVITGMIAVSAAAFVVMATTEGVASDALTLWIPLGASLFLLVAWFLWHSAREHDALLEVEVEEEAPSTEDSTPVDIRARERKVKA